MTTPYLASNSRTHLSIASRSMRSAKVWDLILQAGMCFQNSKAINSLLNR